MTTKSNMPGGFLNHREQLDDREVQEWLEHPENRAVLDQLDRTRQELDKRDFFSSLKANVWKVLKKSAPSLQNTGVEIMDVCGGNRRFGSGDRGLVRIAAGKKFTFSRK